MIRGLVELARLRHWTKGVFLLLPIPFALAAGTTLRIGPVIAGLFGFSLLSSAVYAANDVIDAERDRQHPTKRGRPVAAGRIRPAIAGLWSIALLLIGLGLCAVSGSALVLVLACLYVALNIGYSIGGKHIPVLDVMLLASGFVLRVLLGCALVQAPPSNWLLLCASSLALFLAFVKRRADLECGVDATHRPSLAGYTVAFLDQALAVTAGIALLSYTLYCMEAEVFRPGYEFVSVPFVAYGLFNLLRLTHTDGTKHSPVELLFTFPSVLVGGVLWFVAVLGSVSFGSP